MILVLSGTEDGREVVAKLGEAGHSVTVSVPTVLDAARHATQSAIAGEMDFDRLVEFVQSHDIDGIVDAKGAFSFDLSSDAKRAASICDVRYIKYAKRQQLLSSDDCVVKIDSLDGLYDFLELNFHNTLLDIDDATIERILDGLEEMNFLFVACLKGTNRDYVEELAKRNIPIANILEVDSLVSEEEIYNNLKKFEILNVIVKEGALTAASKIAAAKRIGANVIALDTDRIASNEFCSTVKQVLETVESWGVK